MSKMSERAHAAERLKNDDTFQSVVKEVREAQMSVFLDADSKPEAREEAHVIIRALAKIEGEIDARIADYAFELEKDQHLARD